MVNTVVNRMIEIGKSILDFIIPPRSNYEIVKKLDEKTIYSLPKSQKVIDTEWITPLFQYKDTEVKAIIWELKYKENVSPLETIGKMIFEEIISVISDISLFNSNAEFLLIPIPITTESRVQRGYNQSELIAKSIIDCDIHRLLIYAPQWLRKVKETPKQSHSNSKEERIKNLFDCFDADERVFGKYIFLIDDVVTTGTTLTEARKILIGKGAKDVIGFTIAH
jgi:ComF family protein